MVYKIVKLAVELEFKQYMYFNYIVENSSIGKENWTGQEKFDETKTNQMLSFNIWLTSPNFFTQNIKKK